MQKALYDSKCAFKEIVYERQLEKKNWLQKTLAWAGPHQL